MNSSFGKSFRILLKQIERIAVAFGLLLLFLVVLELLQAYQALRTLHPVAGYGFLVILTAFLLYLVWQIRPFWTFARIPKPPKLEDSQLPGKKLVTDANRYLDEITTRFENNPLLVEKCPDDLDNLRKWVDNLQLQPLDPSGYLAKIEEIETVRLKPILQLLDKEAEAVVSDTVGIVSVGTALSPYRSLDVVIVLNRSFRMVNRILQIYRTRPATRESLFVFYDIGRVIAAVNLLNSTDQLWLGIGRHLPWVGKYGEAVSEGIFSGLFVSVAGHAAIDRCRTYRSWSTQAAAREYRSKLNRWAHDIADIIRRRAFDRIVKKDKPEALDIPAEEPYEEQEEDSTETETEQGDTRIQTGKHRK